MAPQARKRPAPARRIGRLITPKYPKLPLEKRPDRQGVTVGMRSDREIQEHAAEFLERAWWNHHQWWLDRIADGEPVKPEHKAILKAANASAKRIERKYGRASLLELDAFEWGLLQGRRSALNWVMGCPWDCSLDT